MAATTYPAIILAGGLGTRLRQVINDLPKPMAMVNGKPFLHYVFVYLTRQKIKRAILSVGYKAAIIEAYFGDKYLDVEIEYCKEPEPLGTGGGIKKAFEHVSDYAYVLNGDTFFDIELSQLSNFYFEHTAHLALALKPMHNFDRYGAVQLTNNRIEKFEEKKFCAQGLINGGVYFFKKDIFHDIPTQKFSFEKEVLEQYVSEKNLAGKVFDNYFIDIGIPQDYDKAQGDFKTMFG